MANEEWVTEAQARQLAREYGASPDEIEREIARDYRGATWYWSPQQRALVSVYDGQTTVAELGDAMARGPLDERQEAMAADFWVMAAQQANTTTPHLAEKILVDLQTRAEELNHVAALVVDEQLTEMIARHEAVCSMRDELIDRSYHEGLDDSPQKQDEYSDRIWGQACDLVDNGRTVEELREIAAAKRAEDDALEDAYYDEQRAEIAESSDHERAWREAQGPVSGAWRTAAAITYREHVLDYGNDGRPEDDRYLSASEVAARAMAITTIAGATGVPEAYVFAELQAAADAEGSAQGLDNDPDYLAPPNWEAFTDHALEELAAPAEPEDSVSEAGPHSEEGRAAELADFAAWPDDDTPPRLLNWGTGMTEAEARLEASWIDSARGMTLAQLRGDPDTGAAVGAGADDAATAPRLHRHHAVLSRRQIADRLAELTAAAAGQVDDGYTQSPAEQLAGRLMADAQDRGDPPPLEGWSRWAHAQVEQATEDLRDAAAGAEIPGRAESQPATSEELAGALRTELADALDQARAQLDAGDVPEVDRAAHETRIELLEAELAGDPVVADETTGNKNLTDDEQDAFAHIRGRTTMGKFATGLHNWSDKRWTDAIDGLTAAGHPVQPVGGTIADDPAVTRGWVFRDTSDGAVDPPERGPEHAEAASPGDKSVPDELARGGDPVLAAKTAAWMATEAAATQQWLDAEQARRDAETTSNGTGPYAGDHAEDCFGCEHVPGAVHCMTEDLNEPSFGDGESPGKARAADAVAVAHQAIADTQRLNAQRAEQGSAAHWLAADDHAGTVGDEVELGSQDEALPPA